MSLISGLVVVCDLAFYCSLLGMARLLMSAGELFLLMPAVMGVSAGLCHALGEKNGAVRFAPLLLLAACLPLARDGLTLLLLVPPAVYTVFYVKGNRRIIDYYFAFTRFRSSFILLMLVVLFVIFITGREVWLVTLPYLLLYFVLSINLLRMLRHDAKTLRQWKFRIVNLSGTAALFAAGVLFSTGTLLRAFGWVGNALWQSALRPVIAWVIDAATAVIRLFHDLVSRLPWSYESADMSAPMNNFIEVDYNRPGAAVVENLNRYPAVKYVLIVLGISIGAVVFIAVVKLLSRQKERAEDNDLGDTREKLDADGKRRRPLQDALARRRDPALAVRHYYRKFLLLAESRGQEITPFCDSLEIETKARERFSDEEALKKMRALYLPARYSSHPPLPGDAEAARDAYSRLKSKKAD